MIRTIGIMTGNSLDAVDVVLTEFEGDKIKDIKGHTKPIPKDVETGFRELKALLVENGGDIEALATNSNFDFKKLHDSYINIVAETVNELISNANISKKDIDAVGFHGQTCAHLPPSIAKTRDKDKIYTLQVGSGQMLADLLNIPVVFDFRSDDLMNQGEAAPLAPVHNQHIAADLKSKGLFPVAFCNAGNTGNIAIISEKDNKETVMGWDTGPFNHFIDYLCREEKNLPYDKDGELGSKGKINFDLLRALFNKSVVTKDGDNFILKNPPKSSDPSWYNVIPEMVDKSVSFENRLRTVEFFSAYIYVYALSMIPNNMKKPETFLIFGGGWKNPLVLDDFKSLLKGDAKVLDEHTEIFEKIKIGSLSVEWSDKYGYSGQYMEARIFADMAKCKLTNEPFSYPETTGCNSPTVGGIIVKPGGDNKQLWSRAAKGWYKG